MDYLWRDRKRTLFGLPLSFTKYALTEERLFIETGFLNKKEVGIFFFTTMEKYGNILPQYKKGDVFK